MVGSKHGYAPCKELPPANRFLCQSDVTAVIVLPQTWGESGHSYVGHLTWSKKKLVALFLNAANVSFFFFFFAKLSDCVYVWQHSFQHDLLLSSETLIAIQECSLSRPMSVSDVPFYVFVGVCYYLIRSINHDHFLLCPLYESISKNCFRWLNFFLSFHSSFMTCFVARSVICLVCLGYYFIHFHCSTDFRYLLEHDVITFFMVGCMVFYDGDAFKFLSYKCCQLSM